MGPWVRALLQFQFIFDHNDLKALVNCEGEKRYPVFTHFLWTTNQVEHFLFSFTSNTISSFLNHLFQSFASKLRDYEIMTSQVNYISGFFSSDRYTIFLIARKADFDV